MHYNDISWTLDDRLQVVLYLPSQHKEGILTVEKYHESIYEVTKVLERIIDEGIEGIPNKKVHDSYVAALREAYGGLTNAEYPKDFDAAMDILRSLDVICLRKTDFDEDFYKRLNNDKTKILF